MEVRVPISKFRGCVMGGLIGDCFGAPFEGLLPTDVIGHLNKLRTPGFDVVQKYTDDTAMAWDIAESLIAKKTFVAKDMAKKFADSYFKKNRGYGMFIRYVFKEWRDTKYKDVYKPSTEQFNGTGSYGNGGAMRIAPVALFSVNDYNKMLTVARESTLLTHYHRNGYNGALLQCIAIWLALREDPTKPLDVIAFLDSLIEKFKPLEELPSEGSSQSHKSDEMPLPYTDKLKLMKELIAKEDLSRDEIAAELGNEISAIKSVPTAIFTFLKALKPIEHFQVDNRFERTVSFATHLGGDTDTIASMAGSIAGAYYGIEEIPIFLQTCCESHENALRLADQLYSLHK